MNNYNNKHTDYIKNTYSDSNLTIEAFCNKIDFEYLKNFCFLSCEDSLQNSYYIYERKNKTAKKELLGKISNIEYFIDTPYMDEEDCEEIDPDILKDKLLILKIKFSNLQYYTMHNTDIFSKIYLFDENFNSIKSLCNSSLRHSKYGEVIGYSQTYERKYLPKISYSATLFFSVPTNIKNYIIAFENLYVEGNGIKKIQIETRKSKDLSNREKCPKCNSLDTVKDGKRNGKQRYQCNICKRKFTEK